MEILLCFLMGLAVGGIASVLGLGGGFLMVPLLPSILEISQREAIATSVFVVTLVTFQNSWNFHKKKLIAYREAISLGISGALVSAVTAKLTEFFSDYHLKLALLLVLVAIAIRVIIPKSKATSEKSIALWLLLVLGSLGGALAGFTGIGGGILVGPALILLGMRSDQISPSTNVAMFFYSFSALMIFSWGQSFTENYTFGPIHWGAGLFLFFGSIFSSYYGGKYQFKLSVGARSKILLLLIILMITKLLSEIIRMPIR